MKLGLALLLNAALLAGLLPWLRREWQQAPRPLRRLLLPALGLRLLVGGLTNVRLIGDAAGMSSMGAGITRQLWADPVAGVGTLLGNAYDYEGYRWAFFGLSNTFFFNKMLAFLNLASGGIGWLNGLYISLFTFMGCWLLVKTLARVWPAAPAGAGAVAFLLWPSVVVSTSGIVKDAVLLGSGAWLLALVLGRLYRAAPAAGPVSSGPVPPSPSLSPLPSPLRAGATGRARLTGRVAIGGLLLAYVHFRMRYFFAIPLMGCLLGLVVIRLGQRLGGARRRWTQVGLLALVLAGGAWLGPQLSPVFRANKFTAQLLKIYSHNSQTSRDKPHFEYENLRPTVESALRHAPLAVWNTLTRPWLGESRALPYVAAGLDNLALLALLGLAGWALWRGRAGHLPFALVLVLGLHCLLLAFLIGISTPNLGTMHRYRATMLPYLLLLLLQNDYAAGLLARLGLGNAPRPAGPDEPGGPGGQAVPLPH